MNSDVGNRKIEDMCGDLAELAIENEWTPKRLKIEIAQAWQETLEQRAREEVKRVQEVFGK